MRRFLVLVGLFAACRHEEPRVLATGNELGFSFDADATDAFWAEGSATAKGGRIASVPLAGGPVRALATGKVEDVRVSGTWVYFVRDDTDVVRVPRAGGAEEKLAGDREHVWDLAIDGDEVFYVTTRRVKAVKPGAAPRDLGPSGQDPRTVVLTPTDVVWRTSPTYVSAYEANAENGGVFAIARAGGPVRKIRGTQLPDTPLVAYGGDVFFADGQTVHQASMPSGTLRTFATHVLGTIAGADANGLWITRATRSKYGGARGGCGPPVPAEVHHVSPKGSITHAHEGSRFFVMRTTPAGAFGYDGLSVSRVP